MITRQMSPNIYAEEITITIIISSQDGNIGAWLWAIRFICRLYTTPIIP